MLIQNYGLFWKREHIHWGRGKNAGHLKGVFAKNTTGDPVDFREQQGVYVLYDENLSIAYVGQAGSGNQRLFKRLAQHRKDHLAERWTKFSWFGIRKVLKNCTLSKEAEIKATQPKDILNHIEAILIHAAEPPLNRQGGKFGESVAQYLQFKELPAEAATTDEMLRQLLDIVGSQ